MSTSGGNRAIIAALVASVSVAAATFVGFVVTGSSSLLAGSVLSGAGAIGQVLLVLDGRRARQAAGVDHPFGYGRAHYFRAFAATLVSFSLGSLYAIARGLGSIGDADELDSPGWAMGIVMVAIVAHGLSLRATVKESRPLKSDHRWRAFVRRAKVPELPFVLSTGLAALAGLVIAVAAVALAQLTGDPVWDGIGALAMGVVSAIVALATAVGMKSLLIGEGALPGQRERMLAAVGSAPDVERLVHMHTEYLGPDELLIAAKVRFATGLSVRELADAIARTEAAIRDTEPIARVVYLEPDVPDPDQADGDGDSDSDGDGDGDSDSD